MEMDGACMSTNYAIWCKYVTLKDSYCDNDVVSCIPFFIGVYPDLTSTMCVSTGGVKHKAGDTLSNCTSKIDDTQSQRE